jgi:uncharacterized repeat protein (TIGR03803 family)
MSAARFTIIAVLIAVALPASARRLSTLYSFTGGADGGSPDGGLVTTEGTLYGTTLVGGSGGQGTVFYFDLVGAEQGVLHSFMPGTDGQNPSGSLVRRGHFLFGTTSSGGGGSNCLGAGCGTIFQVHERTGKETIAYRFQGGSDGGIPFGGLSLQGGALYGTAAYYGGGYGAVFKLDPATDTETVLHGFTQDDGHQPYAAPVLHDGLLFGTTEAGGNDGCAQEGCGTVFNINPATGAENQLHVFGSEPDAESPVAGLIIHDDALYGTTPGGGAAANGAVFKIDLKTGVETVLHSFDGGRDGGSPTAGLIYVHGALYGTTSVGGKFTKQCTNGDQSIGCGTIYRVNPDTGAETVVHWFTGPDGADPEAGLIYENGTFFGTTFGGGAKGNGTLFKVSDH